MQRLTLDGFRTLFPWSEEVLALGAPAEWLWHYDLAVSADELWRHIIDTSRLNRALGLPEMMLDERQGQLHGEARYGVFAHAWVEEPWDWVSGRYLYSVRVYSRGLSHRGRLVFQLEPQGERAVRLSVYFGWIPRNWFARLCLRVGMTNLSRSLDRVFRRIAADSQGTCPAVLQALPESLSEDARRRVATVRQALIDRGLSRAAIDRLVDHITGGDEMDLTRIQVRALAGVWGIDEHAVLRVCLHATRLGLLTMSWDIICPHCRGVRQEARSLGDVPHQDVCEVCDIDFATNKAGAVEITFHVHPAIRVVTKRFFCSAEPSSKFHIQMQRRLPAGARAEVAVPLSPGRYRMRLHGQTEYRFVDVSAAPDPGAEVDGASAAQSAPATAAIAEPAPENPVADRANSGNAAGHSQFGAAGDERMACQLLWRATQSGAAKCAVNPTVGLVNDTAESQMFIIERASWSDMALRPAQLFSLQEFRDLFSEEYLAAEVQLAVGEQVILFTDIVGSTRFYAQLGDPAAFVQVKRHFAIIYDIVGKHRGAVVKTIGDAVMGAFERPLDAVKAAEQIHQHCAAHLHSDAQGQAIQVRISLNSGPCIAVNLNSNIDYFGSTVNLAAKLQACADAGDIAMTRAVAGIPEIGDYLRSAGAQLRNTVYSAPGLPEAVDVSIWHICSSAAATTVADSTVSRRGGGPVAHDSHNPDDAI